MTDPQAAARQINITHRDSPSRVVFVAAASMVKQAVEIAIAAGADLRDPNLRGAYLGGPNGWRAVAWWRDSTLMVTVACRTKTMEQTRAYWADTPDRREILVWLDNVGALSGRSGRWC